MKIILYDKSIVEFEQTFRIMKITFLNFFLFVCFAFSAETHSQTQRVLMNTNKMSLHNLINEIERQTDYLFIYNVKDIDVNRKVQVNSKKQESVAEILNEAFDGTDTYYAMEGKNIMLLSKKNGSASKELPVQYDKVSGIVKDPNGEPIIGANVSIKGKTTGAITDMDGKFSLDVPDGTVLHISFIGYISKDVKVIGKKSLNIVLSEDNKTLDEIVVVGYGVQRRSDVTGSISSVSAENMNKTPSTSLGEMLRGAAAGVQVSLSNAAPGAKSSVLIRGRRSLSADNSPLYIVDGVPVTNIDDFNSNDIESLEVLKDASSQSIYGSRAANGVILITTKRGSADRTSLSYNGYLAVQNYHRNFEFYNGEEWAAYRKEAYIQAFGTYDEDACFGGLMKDVLNSGEFVDWEKVMIKSALQQKHDILLQSGMGKTKFALGLGVYTQDGMVENSGINRLNGRLNIDHKVTNKFSVGTNITYTKSWLQTADGSFNSFVTMPPLAKIYEDDDVTLRKDVTENGEGNTNPLWNIDNSKNKTITERFLLNLFADWNINKYFSYRFNASMNGRNVKSNSYLGVNHTTGMNTNGKATLSQSSNYDYLMENILNFNAKLGRGHRVDATFMQSINSITWDQFGLSGTGFPNDDLYYNAIGSALEYGAPSYQISDRKTVSFLTRARYYYMNKYLMTMAVRIDGSSVFGKKHKFGYFPSMSVAWRMNEEDFLKDVDWLTNLKLRVSYGQVGNQGVSPYTTLGLTDKYMYEFGDLVSIGYLPTSSLPNKDLKWETSTSSNIGLDFAVLNGRLSGSFEWYNTDTSDLLVYKTLSPTTGYSNQLSNLGKVRNRGVELSLKMIPVKTNDLQVTFNATFSKNNNKILRIDGTYDSKGQPTNDINNKWFIGEPINVYYDYKFDGIWQIGDDISNSCMPTALPGYIKVKDVNGDNVITDDDKVVMYKDPKWIGSLSMSVDYKGIDFSADMYVSHGGIKQNPYLTSFDQGGDLTGKKNGIRRNYWTVNNPSNEAPSPNLTQAPAYVGILGYQDASFIRLRNVQLGYTFPKSLSSKLDMQKLRLYATLTNIWTKTKVLGYGPEQTPGDYPEPRVMLFGVNVTF